MVQKLTNVHSEWRCLACKVEVLPRGHSRWCSQHALYQHAFLVWCKPRVGSLPCEQGHSLRGLQGPELTVVQPARI